MTGSEKEKMDAESQALAYSQYVSTGMKLAASLMVRLSLAGGIATVADTEGCKTTVDADGTWATVWIYRYPFVY